MTALDWVRSKAAVTEIDTFSGDDENGVSRTYRVTRSVFKGTLPYRMARDIRKELSSLIRADMHIETLHIGGQYRSDFGNCEYINSVYELLN